MTSIPVFRISVVIGVTSNFQVPVEQTKSSTAAVAAVATGVLIIVVQVSIEFRPERSGRLSELLMVSYEFPPRDRKRQDFFAEARQ
jgi:hypothetical protein